MDKPEFVWIPKSQLQNLGKGIGAFVIVWSQGSIDDQKFRITYNKAGDVIRLERVEE